MAERGGRRRHKCRYGADCRLQSNPAHTARFWHPGESEICPKVESAAASAEDLSQNGDQHAGTKFPRIQCQYHPGCKNRWTCFYSHGLIHAADDIGGIDLGVPTCFLGQAPHNQGCMNPTWSGEPYDFCSKECREMAKLTPKGPLSCRRYNCPCPCTVNGLAGQYCCKSCYDGTPCKHPTHTAPIAHLIVVAKPEKGRFAPCSREGCACAVEGGSSWDGNPGQYCCRACRNGVPCTKLWHTEPESLRSEGEHEVYTGFTCALPGCPEPPWNGREGEYCCMDHRHMAMGNYVPPVEDEPAADADKTESQRLLEDVDVPREISFPNFAELWRHSNGWVHSHSAGAHKGKVAMVWFNESLACVGCPSRQQFERAVQTSKCDDFRRGEFGWHGTGSIEAVNAICWSNLDTARRNGQCYGPGEYFSRGTTAGLNYSEGYAGGTAGNLLIVFWVMSHELGAAPTNPGENGAANGGTSGHIVCQNPTTDGMTSTGEMYCVPVAVVAFGSVMTTPDFRTFNPNMKDPDVSDLLRKVQEKCQEAEAKQSDKCFIQSEQLMLKKSEALLKHALEGTDVEALQAAIAQVQTHCLVDTSLLDKAQTMVGPKCIEQLEAASGSESNPESLQNAIKVAEKLSASGGIFVEPAVLQTAKDRLPVVRCEYSIRIAVETGDIAALRGAISKVVEGLDPTILQEACQKLVEKTEEQLRNAMAGTDVSVLQKAISQATSVDDGLPKEFSEDESNWLPVEGVPHLDASLLDEARTRLVAMKYENGLSIVIQQVTDGVAPPIKLANTLKQSADIEGVNAELLDQARQLLATKCDTALETSKASGDEVKMMAAVVLSDGIDEVNGDLLAEVRQSALESCENKVKAAETQLNDSCDGSSASTVQQALANAQMVQTQLKEILGVCQESSLFEDVSQRLVFDETLVEKAQARQMVLIYEEALKTLMSRVAEETDHVSNLKFWTDLSAVLPCLADVDPELVLQSQAAMKESCESKLQAALESVELLDSLIALSWSTGIDGLDEALLEAVAGLIESRCKDLVAEHEQALQDVCGGDDLASLEGVIANAAGLPDVLPTDPNLGWLARAPPITPEEVQQALSNAQSVSEALPPAWGPAEGKPRVREELLGEARQRLLVDAPLLGSARHRVVILKSEAVLRAAAAGDDLDALRSAIGCSESVEGLNEDLLAEARKEAVQKGEAQLQAACDSGNPVAIRAKLDQVGPTEGVDSSAVANAEALMKQICEEKLRSLISGQDPVMLRQEIATSEAVRGATPSLLQEARARATALEAELQLRNATKLGDVANLKTVLARCAGVAGVDPSVIESAKSALVTVCQDQIQNALNADNADQLRQAITEAESVENVDALLLDEARKRLEILEKPKSTCCAIV